MRPAAGVEVCLALDVGGTKLEAALVDERARILSRELVRTPTGDDPDELLGAIESLVVSQLSGAVRVGAVPVVVGVGIGGPMEPGGVAVSPLHIPAWRGFPLPARLREIPAMAGLPVSVDNDAKALALGEAWAGGGRGVADFIAVTVSTGIGGGIFLDGHMLEGRTGNAGHIGHVVVEPAGRPCRCGGRGCLEAETSGVAIEEITGAPAALAGPEIKVRAGELVGRALGSVASLLDLDLALVGGSVALGYGDTFFVAANESLGRTAAIAHARSATIRPAPLGGDGPLLGAAALGWRGLGRLATSAP